MLAGSKRTNTDHQKVSENPSPSLEVPSLTPSPKRPPPDGTSGDERGLFERGLVSVDPHVFAVVFAVLLYPPVAVAVAATCVVEKRHVSNQHQIGPQRSQMVDWTLPNLTISLSTLKTDPK